MKRVFFIFVALFLVWSTAAYPVSKKKLKDTVAERDATIVVLEGQVAEKDATILRLEAELETNGVMLRAALLEAEQNKDRADSLEAKFEEMAEAKKIQEQFDAIGVQVAAYEATKGDYSAKLKSVKTALEAVGIPVKSNKPWYRDGMPAGTYAIVFNEGVYGDKPELREHITSLVTNAIGGSLEVRDSYDSVVTVNDAAAVWKKYGKKTVIVVFPAK